METPCGGDAPCSWPRATACPNTSATSCDVRAVTWMKAGARMAPGSGCSRATRSTGRAVAWSRRSNTASTTAFPHVGTAIDPAGADMRDILTYFAFLSRGVTVAPPTASAGARLQKWATFTVDTAAGARVFSASCAKCHGAAGEGTPGAPPVWGPQSYNIGAGMSRVRTAAEFISRNMPFDAPGSLADQQAFDVAAFINARPRPDYKGKENDWPNGDPPPDVAYTTRAHH